VKLVKLENKNTKSNNENEEIKVDEEK